MNERVIQFRVGVVVVAATIITGIMIMLIGEGKMLIRRQYTINMLFDEAPGVTIDTPVRKHGVLIGRVSAVELLDDGGVKLSARVDADRGLGRNEIPLIKTASLLGDAVIDFVPGNRPPGEVPPGLVQDNEIIADGLVATNPVEVITNLQGDMQSAIVSIQGAATEVQQLARSVNQALGTNDGRIRTILEKSEGALDQFTRTMNTIDNFVGNPQLQEDFQATLRQVPGAFDDVKQTLGDFRKTLERFDEIADQASQNLQNLNDFTRPLGERGEQLATDVAATAENLNVITEQFVTFSEALNNREGTLGRIIYDEELYDRLNEAVLRVNRASRRIEPILSDIRVFSDKIARDPRELGLKGAFDRSPLGTGLKSLRGSQ